MGGVPLKTIQRGSTQSQESVSKHVSFTQTTEKYQRIQKFTVRRNVAKTGLPETVTCKLHLQVTQILQISE